MNISKIFNRIETQVEKHKLNKKIISTELCKNT